MTALGQYGITADLPLGWEGRIYRREAQATTSGTAIVNAAGERSNSIVHAANFALPADVDDYGGKAVEAMTNVDLLVVLAEFGPASAGTALFAPIGMPRLATQDFAPETLQRFLPGQSATQRFFSVAGRPFSLYVVLGSHLRRVRTVPVVNTVLSRISIT